VVEDVDESRAVPCPLPAGGATFHHSLTLHYAAPNVSTRARRAYVIEFEARPILRDVPVDKPWVAATRVLLGEPTERRYLADGEWRL
jgi:hypothetical protein